MSDMPATCCVCGTCASCSGEVARPPVADPLAFAHGAIKHRMLSRIGSTEVEGRRPLDALSTRDDDDPTVALIDAFAGSLHILAWNAARLYQDGTIRHTEDRDALVDLTRLLGYEPRPALAATTTLTFTLDNFDTSPKVATIPKGTKIASVPGQNEKPQTFETDADLAARAEWNVLRPPPRPRLQRVDETAKSIVLDGIATTAKVGDLVLIYLKRSTTNTFWLCARIGKITRQPTLQPPQTDIDLTSPKPLTAEVTLRDDALENSVIILGQRAAAFGANAPDLALMPREIIGHQADPTEWDNLVMTGDLDAVYSDAVEGRFVFFTTGTGDQGDNQIGRIDSVIEKARVGFGLSAKVSKIHAVGVSVTEEGDFFHKQVRATTISLETAREKMLITEADVMEPDAGSPDRIRIAGTAILPTGRHVVLTGKQWDGSSVIGEVATVKSCTPLSGSNTLLEFDRNLDSRFHSNTLQIFANCVGASHGETPAGGAELIGSSKASTPSPRFKLKGAPLTYLPAINPRGYAPAIEVRVGDRLYSEQPTIFGLDSPDRAYSVKPVREGNSEVQFAGRLPSGTHNVSALYRVGGGTAGNLAAGRLRIAMTPIMGVGAVSNPIPADGGSDRETIDDARKAAPQSIRTLDRVVSLSDFEAFARGFRGVGKALATDLHVGMRSVVCLTIATSSLESPASGSDIIKTLRKTLAQYAAPGRSVRIEGFTDLTAIVTVAMVSDPTLDRADVEAAVRAALASRFGRAARRFGEALHRSELLAAVQGREGVLAATLRDFRLPNGPPESEGRLLCPAPVISGGVFQRAGLLSLDPDQIRFEEMPP